MGRLEVVQDKNDDSNMEDDVFQLSENLNVVLSCNGQAPVNEDYDNIDINVEDYDGTDDESLKKKEEEILTNYQKIKV